MDVNTVLCWESRFETGDPAVDFDHQVLFALVNELHCSILDGLEPARSRDMVIDFARYANRHFATEESLMVSCGFPGIAEHREAHERLRTEVAHMAAKEYLDGLELCLFAYDWLIGHIIAMDMPMIEHVRRLRPASLEWDMHRDTCTA